MWALHISSFAAWIHQHGSNEKRSCALFSAGNGDWGAIHGWSCCTKDISNKLPSFKLCEQKLIKGLYYSKCKRCCNWDIQRSNYSDDVIKLANGCAKKPCKLSLSSQHAKSKEICNKLTAGKMNRKLATM